MASLDRRPAAASTDAESARHELEYETLTTAPLDTDAGSRGPAGQRRRGPRTVLLVIVLAAALAATTFWAGTRIQTRQAAIPRNVIEPIATVPIEHRRLVDLIDASGEVVRPSGRSVSAVAPDLPAGTQPLVTGLPARIGQELHDGSEIVEVAGRPVFVFQGAIPMYRTLSTGDSGPDVGQLQAALGRVGLSVADPPGQFGPGTAAALTDLFLQRGYRIADSAAPDDASASPGEGPASSGGSAPPGAGSSKPVHLTLPASSIVYVPELPATVTSLRARIGAHEPSDILSLSTGDPVVRIRVSTAEAQSVPRGAEARIVVGGHTRRGRVAGRRSIPGSGGLTALLVRPMEPLRGSIRRQVPVRIIKARTPHAAWVVPFSAVGTASDGSSFVELVRRGRRLRVPVRLGMTARGYVAVSALHGMRFAAGEVVAADA
jgi:membrane fusion protein, multidrug efflux system